MAEDKVHNMANKYHDMMDMLGLDKRPNREGRSSTLEIQSDTPTKTTYGPLSVTALKLDKWDVERGVQCLASSPNLQAKDLSVEEVADFHGTAFLIEPELNEECHDPKRLEFIRTMMETSDYQSLHSQTMLNDLASELAATQFGMAWAEFASTQAKEASERAKKPRSPKSDAKAAMKQEMALLAAASNAVKQAQQDVEDCGDVQKAMGIGDNEGGNGKTDPKAIAKLFQEVRNNPRLKEIFELAGRYRMMAQSKQRGKIIHGMDDMVGIELSGDLSRLLPSELLKLMDEDFELDALRRLVEGQSMSREYRGVETLGKGPVIVCVDESGSMKGDKIANAKAFALSMAWIARHQKRWCCLVGYSAGPQGTCLILPPGQKKEAEIIHWLEHFYGGGTSMDVPFDKVPFDYWKLMNCPKGKTDMILITDGLVNVGERMKNDFLDWKQKEKVRCITLIVQGEAGDLAAVSDEVHTIKAISTTEESIGKCLSI